MAENQQIFKPGKYGSSYGSISKCSKKVTTKSPLVEHRVKISDSLISLAIRYETSVEEIKRLNNVWSNESLQIKGVVKIPVSKKQVEPLAPTPESADLENFVKEDCLTPTDKNNVSSRVNKVGNKPAKMVKSQTYCSDRDISDMNAAEFLQKYDFQIMRLKGNVEKLEAESSLSEEDTASLNNLPRRTSKFMSHRTYRPHNELLDQDDPLTSPEMVVKSQQKAVAVDASAQLSAAHDDFYNL